MGYNQYTASIQFNSTVTDLIMIVTMKCRTRREEAHKMISL